MFPNQTQTILQMNNSKGSIRGASVESIEDGNTSNRERPGVLSSLNMAKMRENMNKTEILTKREKVNISYCSGNGGTATHQSAARQTLTALANNNPGPGAYKTFYDNILRSNPRPIIGTSKRKELTSKDIMNTPGPANYLPNIDAVKRSHNHGTIGNEQRGNKDTLR